MSDKKELALLNYLSGFITPHKVQLFDSVLSRRTRFLTVVLEDIYQSHNASAVLRSCDCFGIQDVHVIENTNEYVINPQVSMGSYKWVDIYRHNESNNNSLDCIKKLKSQGYLIAATTPSESAIDISSYPISTKVALFFGTELTGLSKEVIDNADVQLRVPMQGFTESYNISVSAALILFSLRQKLENSTLAHRLTEKEKQLIKLNWIKKALKKSESYIDDFNRNWDEEAD